MKTAFIPLALALFLVACTGTVAVIPTSTPTSTELPAATPTATSTLEPTPEPPTITPTYDISAPGILACKMRSQSIRNGSQFDPKERFDMAWQVENFGYVPWQPEEIRATYFSGTRMQVNDTVSLREVVNSDEWTQFVVPMQAPRASGRYTTVWALWLGDNDFCHMTLTIVVR